jgi:CBS domain-containing protein
MQVAFFLTPKSEVLWVPAAASLDEALQLMNGARFSAVPLLHLDGRYAEVLTTTDVLWQLVGAEEHWRRVLPRTSVLRVARRNSYRAVHVDAEIETLIERAVEQNFVPVVDDRDVFIGIVTRRKILDYLARGSK